ncbi:MAG: hypothetical protein KDK90_20850 [Leptospiraceae bacterium]|nr:hypothetical protein [Leptospiraceae bacterium]
MFNNILLISILYFCINCLPQTYYGYQALQKEKENNQMVFGILALMGSSSNGAIGTTLNNGSTTSKYSIGGTITGLNSDGLVLQNNGGDDLSVNSGSTNFTFATKLVGASNYSVTVKIQPTGMECSLSNGTGTANADITNVNVNCIIVGIVTTLAGSGNEGSADGTGTSASFYRPFGITTDGTNLYVADNLNYKIRKIVIASKVVTTLAGSGSQGLTDATGTSASFNAPIDITTDGINLYVTDYNKIRKIDISSGVVTTLAGSTSHGSADGTGTSASFASPSGITIEGSNLYVADAANHKIRKIVISSGFVTTLAGSGSQGSEDGMGTAASFNVPYRITTDGTNLYIADFSNHKIRKIEISSKVVTTLAGSGSQGSTDGTGTSASFSFPVGITNDGTNLYVVDSYNNKIRKIVMLSGVVTTFAGSGSIGSEDGTGTGASFSLPKGITTDGANLYVADAFSNKIRKIEWIK